MREFCGLVDGFVVLFLVCGLVLYVSFNLSFLVVGGVIFFFSSRYKDIGSAVGF